MNVDKNKNIFSSQQNSENIPLAESLEKDVEFIRIKNELVKISVEKSPEVIAWDKETGLRREFVIEENKNYLEARRIFRQQYPNRYQEYLQLEEVSLPTSKIKTDPKYTEERQEKLIPKISEKAQGKSELTYEEYEKIIDELPIEKVPPQPEFPVSQPVVKDEKEEEKRLSFAEEQLKKRAEKAVEKQVQKRFKIKATKPSRAGKQILRTTRDSFKKATSRIGKTVSRKTSQAAPRAVSRLGGAVVKAGSRALAALPEALAGAGSTILEVFGIGLGIIAAITAAIGWFIAQTIIFIIFLVVTVAFILFIINSGAYIVPPGGLAPIGGGPGGRLPDSCPGIWPIEIGSVTMTQGAYAAGCSHSADNGLEATDYGASEGHEVYAGHDGSVVVAEWDSCVGYHIIIESTCNGRYFRSLYGHLSVINTRSGENVSQGQPIGRSGNTGSCTTGPHLHYSFQCPDADNPCGAVDDSYINRPPYMSEPYLPLPVPRGCCTETHDCGISF